jgi:hypothetical protein
MHMTLKVKEFCGLLLLEGSPSDDAQFNKEVVQIGSFMFNLSAFLYFSRQMTLKLTLKVSEFCGHQNQTKKVH